MTYLNYNKNNILFINNKDINIGDTIKIGKNTWEVLYSDENRALMISQLLLDTRTFHVNTEIPVSYKDSSIREYLNHNFIIYNFNRDIIPLIEKTPIKHNNGEITYDRIFLLSKEEAKQYFKDNNHRKAIDTFKYNEPWWLRDQDCNLLQAYYINKEGKISHYPCYHNSCFGLRPAFCIKLNKEYNWADINKPLLADTNYKIDKPYIGMPESEIENTKCGPYYNSFLTPSFHSYTWRSYLDCYFLRVSVENGIVIKVMEMYPSTHWNEDGTPIYKGIQFQ